MSLPAPGTQFPPLSVTRDELTRWADLYAGRTIGKQDTLNPDPDLASVHSEADRERRRVRVGLAADIAATSAALVMGKSLHFRITPQDSGLSEEAANATDDRLEAIAEASNLLARLHEGEEMKSALGGVYYRAVADPSLSPVPYVTPIDPTRVEPVFVDGQLVAATIWTEVRVDGMNIYRWVENRDNRTRLITAALYKGTAVNFGSPVPMDSIPETTGLPTETAYPAGINRMVWYVPNLLPNRRHPSSPQGRADIQGSESLCAAVDIVYTSLMRDIRLGRARIIVPTTALTPGAVAGTGANWNAEKEVFTTLDIDPASESSKITLLQGEVRTQEHVDAALAMVERAVTAAGYSPQTFGIGITGSAESGTALKVREARTLATVEAKRRYWTPVIADMAYTLLALDAIVYASGVTPAVPQIEWAEVREVDSLASAQTIETLMRARAISVESAVRQANPDFTEGDVAEETERILQQNGLAVDASFLPGEQLFTEE